MPNDKQFTAEEKTLLGERGMPWRLWALIQRKPNYIIVRNLVSGDVRMVEKSKIPS